MYSHFSSVLDNVVHKSGQIVLAFSGGVDSRVLLHLLAHYQRSHPELKCIAVHVHHGLSNEADNWAQLCSQWCRSYGIDISIERVKLNLGSQISTEQEARDKRYQVLGNYIEKGDVLLTGQHANDQVETFLLALKRGSGPKGLSSMAERAPFRQGLLVRPLLSITQDQIHQYAQDENLKWVEDTSNSDTSFDRNFLRHQIVPALTSRWPGIEKSVLRSAKLCADQESLLDQLLQEKLDELVDANSGISISKLSQQSELARNQLLRMWLGQHNCLMPSAKQLSLIWTEVALSKTDASPKLQLVSGVIRRFKGALYCTCHHEDVSQWTSVIRLGETITLPDHLGEVGFIRTTLPSTMGLRAPRPNEKVWIGFEPEGLIAHPTNRGHKRKLKKLFQEYSVPSWLRKRTPIIMYDDKLALVADLFVDKDFYGHDCEIVWNQV